MAPSQSSLQSPVFSPVTAPPTASYHPLPGQVGCNEGMGVDSKAGQERRQNVGSPQDKAWAPLGRLMLRSQTCRTLLGDPGPTLSPRSATELPQMPPRKSCFQKLRT